MMLMTVSDLPLERIARGKVRDVYAVDAERLLLVATDRVSAYDVVMAEPIPQKGAVLTQVSAWWFRQLGDLLDHHMISADADEIIAAVVAFLSSRGSISRAAEMLGVHRNTVQVRVRRAEELGLPLSDPDRVLSSFMILSVLQGEIEAKRAD